MSIPGNDLVKRTAAFSQRVIRLVDALPARKSAEVVGRQLLRSACSVSANYRAARRGRSKAEFLAKLGIVEEELDESIHWIEIIVGAGLIPQKRVEGLLKEADELLRIIVASIKTARKQQP